MWRVLYGVCLARYVGVCMTCFVLLCCRVIGSGDMPSTAETKNMINVVVAQDSDSNRDSKPLILCNYAAEAGSGILRDRGHLP